MCLNGVWKRVLEKQSRFIEHNVSTRKLGPSFRINFPRFMTILTLPFIKVRDLNKTVDLIAFPNVFRSCLSREIQNKEKLTKSYFSPVTHFLEKKIGSDPKLENAVNRP